MLNNKNNRNENLPGSALNIVGTGTTIKGDMISDGDLRIDGRIVGNVSSKSKVALGAGASIAGNVQSRSADISGKIDGDVEILETVFLRATAVINGNVRTSKIVIESGAVFNGTCIMSKQVEPKAAAIIPSTVGQA